MKPDKHVSDSLLKVKLTKLHLTTLPLASETFHLFYIGGS